MKKMAIIPWNKEYLGNALFDLRSTLNRDNGLMIWVEVRNYLNSHGWAIHTIDFYKDIKEVEIFVFFSFSKFSKSWYRIIRNNKLENKTVYVAFEPPVVDKNHSKDGIYNLLKYFKYILTWNDELVDNERIFKFMYPYFFDKHSSRKKFNDLSLLVNISSNKMSSVKDELYTERKKVIEYFDKTGEFELYGNGWSKNEFSSYKGLASSKEDVYKNFKFALCFENMKNIKGYITEKIFDCFCAGIVPIYLGASNIDDYIPLNCYIPYDSFTNLEFLKKYLSEMKENDYNKYLHAANSYLKSDKTEIFKPETFAKNLLNVWEQREDFNFVATGNWGREKYKVRKRNIYKKIKDKAVKFVSKITNQNGQNIQIGANSYVDDNSIIGEYTYIGTNCSITKSIIGRYVSIGNNVSIGPGEHRLDRISTSSFIYDEDVDWYEELTEKNVVIGNDVWIGTDSIIKRGVKIGNGAVIGANSFVNKDVPAFTIVAGSPAKFLRYRFDEEKCKLISESKWWDEPLDKAKLFINKLDQKW